MATSVATWSLRERAVCSLPPTGPDDLGEPALDRHVHVLVVRQDLEAVVVDLGADLGQAHARSPPGRSAPMIPLVSSMRACASDCSMS